MTAPRLRGWRRRQPSELPFTIYASCVDALFGDPRSLFVGSFSICVLSLMVAVTAGSPILCAWAVALGGMGGLRASSMRRFGLRRPSLTTNALLQPWERQYVLEAGVHVALLGTFCLAAFLISSDPFVRLASFGIVLGHMLGASGRNFASKPLVVTQIAGAGIPVITALGVTGPMYLAFAVFGLVPFFISVQSISKRLRGIMLEAAVRANDMRLLADRFDTALNNMPHGLAMFDANARLAVANAQFFMLLRLRGDTGRNGKSANELVELIIGSGLVAEDRAPDLAIALKTRLREPMGKSLLVETSDDRALALTFHRVQQEGSLVIAEDITERRNADARISHLARFDALTGLPNRFFFREQAEARLAAVAADGFRYALLFIDLDKFKQVNDTLGHSRGDKLLCAVATRLRNTVDPQDVLARFGGDEFVLLHRIVESSEEVERLAGGLINVVSEPYQIEGHAVVIGATIGISLTPSDAHHIDQMLRNADLALYAAKSDQRGVWSIFSPSMDTKAKSRRLIELDLHGALANNEFELHYQPIFDLKAKEFRVFEALIRWRHPERGMVAPGEFVPVAEEMGIIAEIGNWVLREACRQAATWPSSVRVAVNISSVQLRRGRILAATSEALIRSGLHPSRLELEITESALLQNLQFAQGILQKLREMGVNLSLDDFGTGYSSLSYLHTLPLNKVKIDRSFLAGFGSDQKTTVLLRGIARLSAELGLTVVVEGVETEEQLSLVAAEPNIDQIQGFLFSRPVPAGDVHRLLRHGPRPATAA